MRDLKKPTKSLETRKIRKILNEEARLGLSPNSDSEAEEVDLQKELYPLGYYINNREEMIEQMFSIIKGVKLKKMLPTILKDMPLDELKADCLIHLLGMSKKRIKAILDGREIDSSSDSESHSDSSTSPNKKPKVEELKPFVIKLEGCSDISDNSEEVVLVDPDLDFLNLATNDSTKEDKTKEKKKSKRKLKKKELDKKHKRTKTKVVEASDSDGVQQIDSSAESASENEAETDAPKEGKTLLEILELEMRARAIRALLKTNDPQESEEPQSSVGVQNPAKSKDKLDKQHLKGDTAKKITPARNFRKKKRKNDDVIVIAPKVVTIDLTDENEQLSAKNNTETIKESSPSSTQNNCLNDESEGSAPNNKPEANNEGNQSIFSDKTIVVDEESPNEKDISERPVSCPDEKLYKTDDGVDKIAEPAQGKSNWAQRWLESKEVKKVVSTSKICGNIRKKIKSAKLAKKQTPVQDEPVIPPSSPQKEIEGSVVEYELLSKSKTASNSDVDKMNVDKQVRMHSTNEETIPPEDTLMTATADQVQDVSSTRAENLPTNLTQDPVEGLQTNEDETVHSNSSRESDTKLNVSVKNDDTIIPSIAEEENNKASDHKCLDDSKEENENKGSTNEKGERVLNDGNENRDENKVIEEEPIKISETINSEALREDSNSIDELSGSLHTDVINTIVSESEACCMKAEKSGSNSSKTIDVHNDNELFQESKNQFKIDPEIFERIKEETIASNDYETSKKELSCCSAKSTQELNELEALEINITDEDRDIEDAIEESSEPNQQNNVKDNIIVVD